MLKSTSSEIFIPHALDGPSSYGEPKSDRALVFAELRNFPIPQCVINAVEQHASNAPVYWITRSGLPPQSSEERVRWILTEDVEPGSGRADYGGACWLDEEVPPARDGMAKPFLRPTENLNLNKAANVHYDETFQPDNYPQTAGETLAMCLTECAIHLREVPDAPSRGHGLLSKKTISQIAFILLCDGRVGIYLELLFLVLLDLDRPRLKSSKQSKARYEAAWIVAQSGLGPRAIARRVHVAPSTVSRWLKELAFKKEVNGNRKTKESLVKKGKWPPPDGHLAKGAKDS